MRVRVRVRDSTFVVDVGPGLQRLKWLTMVALQRYSEDSLIVGNDSLVISQSNVATGLMDASGKLLPPNQSIRVALEDGQEVFALLQADQENRKGSKGTSLFLMSQGAAPTKCVINGPSVTYALAGQPVHFYITARDTYGNLARNGGEVFNVKVTQSDGYTSKQIEQFGNAADDDPTVDDCGDGSYIVNYSMRLKGKYEVNVQLDGEPIAGSPFLTVVVKTNVPPLIKWLQPRIGGMEPPKCSNAVCCAYGRTILLFGGLGNLKPTVPGEASFFGQLLMLNIERMKWEVPRVSGVPPCARGGCTSVLAGHRLYIYGGLVELDAPPTDELWCLDMELLSWSNLPIRGVSPGRLAYSAAASVGNKCFFYGGFTGEEALDSMHVLDVVSHMWEPVEENQDGRTPAPRYGHSLLSVGSRLIMYGGRDLHRHYSTLAVYDTKTEVWSHPQGRGDVCRERAFHTACLWGRRMVLCLGYDGSNTTNLLSMLDVDTFYWDTWDGNLVRTGAATALVEGKLFVVGGDDMGDKYSELYQYNMGGFMMQFDGVDDEIMIPHLPTIIPLQYTIEAWVKPARVGPMNIVARSDETHPMAAWSHQLRINANGRFEHYCESDDKYTVAHTVTVNPGTWYHVAGVAVGEGEMKLMVDGQEEGQPVDIGPLRQKLDRYFVGSSTGDGMGMFEGCIAELRVWNLALSEDSIREQMRKVLTGTERGLVGYWRINEGPGGLVFDSSSYGNVGPIKGEPQWTANMVPVHDA